MSSLSNETYLLLRQQEGLYWMSYFLNYKWYRKLFGGKWRFLKLGRDTPWNNLFCTWTKMDDKCWEGYKEVLATEQWPYTGVNTTWRLWKQLIITLWRGW